MPDGAKHGGIGHNGPPAESRMDPVDVINELNTELARLKGSDPTKRFTPAEAAAWAQASWAKALARADALAESAGHLSTVTLDGDSAKGAVTLAKQITMAEKDIDAAAKTAAAVYSDAVKMVRALFKGRSEALDKAKDIAKAKLADWMSASGVERVENDLGHKAVWHTGKADFEINDPGALPLGFLKPDTDAIRAALDDGETVPGVRVVPPAKSVVVS